ncbi:MAG: hypothetical protein ACRD5G_11150, partial [Candidatus Acidiferrales bacterium]
IKHVYVLSIVSEPSGQDGGCVAPGFAARLLNRLGLGVVYAAPAGLCAKHWVDDGLVQGFVCDSERSNCTDAEGKHGVCQTVQTFTGTLPVQSDCECKKIGGHRGGKG